MSNQDSEVLDDILRNLSWAQHELGAKGLIPLSKHEYEAKAKIESIIRTEKLKLLAEVRERVVGEDEKLVIPDYPKTDDEGEPLYSKRAAKEGRKQVTARYHTRKELRNDQRTELTKLEAEL